MFKFKYLLMLVMLLTLSKIGYSQNTAIIQGIYNNLPKTIAVASDGSLILSGSITGGNGAASNTGSAVPSQAGYNGLNVAGTLRGQTGTNTSGVVYAGDVNCVAGCSGGTSDTDDGTIATGQSTGLTLGLMQAFDGTNWKRLTTSVAGAGLSSGVLTVQGNALMTPLIVTSSITDSAANTPVSTSPIPAGCVYYSAPVTLSDTYIQYLLCDTKGRQVLVGAGTAGTATGGVVTVQGVASMTPVLTTLSGTNSITGTISLPTGASTSAKQPALGTAGTASADVISVQGIASMTPLSTTSTIVDCATETSVCTNPVPVGGVYYSSPTALTNGQIAFPLLDTDHRFSVNVGKFNGVTPLMGNGTSGTGAQRVAIASDNSPVAGLAIGATGSAVPANAIYIGGRDASGNLKGDITCELSKIYDTNTSGNTELVAISGSKHIYVCYYEMLAAGTVNGSLVTGTGSSCGSAASGTPSTGTSGASAALTPAWQLTAQTGKISGWPTHGYLFDTGSANALCFKASTGVAAQVQVFYHQE
jgi:hypothetical protein